MAPVGGDVAEDDRDDFEVVEPNQAMPSFAKASARPAAKSEVRLNQSKHKPSLKYR
jgi:hypothetical protein